MKRLRVLLELPILCLILTGAFTIGAHAISISWTGTPPEKIVVIGTAPTRSMEEAARITIRTYCSGCHQSGRSGMDFNDETLQIEDMRRDRSAWELVVKRLRGHEMPPRKSPQPHEEERDAIISWIEREVLQWPDAGDTGRFMVRRLDRSEYVSTIRDLLGIPFQPPADFPKDDINWRRHYDVPEISAILMEKYRSAAEKLLDQASAAERSAAQGSTSNPPLFTRGGTDKPDADHARDIFARFMRRAHRKLVDPVEVDRLVMLFERAEQDGNTFEEGIKAALTEVLTSPHFLYRIETRDGADSSPVKVPQRDQFALASRLSFFLWRSMPDDELLEQAEQGVLAQNLESQARRLLRDSRSRALAVDFAASWLSLGKLDDAGELDDPLRQAMRRETEHFVGAILREDRSVLEFLDADYTFLNERLAEHYGIAGVRGDQMRRVSLRGTPRGGLLGHASVLRITSPYFETSPVNRGKWVLENLLGAAPIRPPAGLSQSLEEVGLKNGSGTMRQQLEKHRDNRNCAQCHGKMDAIGLALENFDARGAWRTEWAKQSIEAIGDLPDGETLNGMAQVKTYLLKHREHFVRGLGEKMLRFALGRKLDDRDRAALERMPGNVAKDEHHFSRVILEVVQSASFQRGFSDDEIRPDAPTGPGTD